MTRADFRARLEPHPGVALAGDRVRQAVVIVAVVFAIVAGVLAATGPDGIAGLQSGAFDTDGSFLGAAADAYAIWILLYAGLAAYAVWQVFPAQAATARLRAVGWWIAGFAALEGLWALVARYGPQWATVVVAFALLAVLVVAFVRVVRSALPRSAWVELLLVDGVVGLHFGWVILAAFADLAALLTTLDPAFWSARAPLWGGMLVVVVAAAGIAASAFSHWRVMPPLAIAWGLFWIALGRLAGEPYSEGVGITALIGAIVLVVVPALIRVMLALRTSVD